MVTETYPTVPGHTQRRIVSNSFDVAGRLSSFTSTATTYSVNGDVSVAGISYAPHGALDKETLGNGLTHDINYNSRLQPFQIRLGTTTTPTSVLDLTYNYGTSNNNGNVLDVTEKIGAWTAKQIYTYDSLNRLDKTEETNGSTTTHWTEDNLYDRFGNRWEVIGGIPSLSFNNKNQINGYTYDFTGNVTDDNVHTYAYDAENRINTVDGVANTYVYDGEGKRVRKYFPLGEQVRFVYGVSGQLIMEFSAVNGTLKKEYVYGAGGLLATIEPASGAKYSISDHLGSPRVVTDRTGGGITRHDYKPFGRELGADVGGRTTGQGFGVEDGVRQHFTSQQRDDETGLDYFGARYYESITGRFTSADSVQGSTGDPQSLNLYAYVQNNPLKYIDPTGNVPRPFSMNPLDMIQGNQLSPRVSELMCGSEGGNPTKHETRWLQTPDPPKSPKVYVVPLGDLRGNIDALLKKNDCEAYTTWLLGEAARLFAGNYPHIKTIREGYDKIQSMGKYTLTGREYDTVKGDLYAPGATPGEVTLVPNRSYEPLSAEMTKFFQEDYAYTAVHETAHLGKQGGYSDEQMAAAAYSLDNRKLPEPPKGKESGYSRVTYYSGLFDKELQKHCPLPKQPTKY